MGGGDVRRHAPAALLPETPGTHCIGWVPGPVWTSEEILAPPPPGFDPRTVQPVASHILQLHVATTTGTTAFMVSTFTLVTKTTMVSVVFTLVTMVT